MVSTGEWNLWILSCSDFDRGRCQWLSSERLSWRRNSWERARERLAWRGRLYHLLLAPCATDALGRVPFPVLSSALPFIASRTTPGSCGVSHPERPPSL